MGLVVVDASEQTERDVRDALSGLGCQLIARDTGNHEGLAAPVDVLVHEVTEDRDRTLNLLRTSTGRTPVVALCLEPSDSLTEDLFNAGVNDVQPLPLDPRRLRARIQMVLRDGGRKHEDQHLRILLELTQKLASTLDFQEILYTLVRRIAEVAHVDRVSIVLVPDGRYTGYVIAASDDAELHNLQIDLRKYPEIRHVLSTKAALTIADAHTHPVLDGVRASVTDLNVRALTLLPILWERDVMGVLFIRGADETGALSDRQLDTCQILANATAIALRNARILQDLREETRRDTQARLEAERQMEALQRYADLFASAVDGVAAFDTYGRLLFANPAAYQLFGFTEASLPQGTALIDLVADQDRRKAQILGGKFMRGRYPRNIDLTISTGHGNAIISGSFSPLRGTEGAVLFSFRDVTEARAIQRELEHTKSFLQSLIDASVDAIVASDMSGKIILFNSAAVRLYGYTQEEATELISVRALYPQGGAVEVGRMLRSPAYGGVGRLLPVRMDAVDKQGDVFPISLTAATIYEGDKVVANFGIFTDLRERLRVEEQLAQAQQQLAVSEKQALVAELAGAMAHELNQPLTSVMASAELLLRKLKDDQNTGRAVNRMYQEASRIAEIVRKIGHLTRYETTPYVGKQKILDINRAAANSDDAATDEAL